MSGGRARSGPVVARVRGEDVEYLETDATGIVDWATRNHTAGVYEVDRTYPGPSILKVDEHLDRFEASAKREGATLRVDRAAYRRVLRQLVLDCGSESTRYFVRMSFARPEVLEFVVEPFAGAPSDVYEKGVDVAVMKGAGRTSPESKTSGWMKDRKEFPLPEGAYEGLLVSSDGGILEGATSNFYAIREGVLWTADEQILKGIARQIVLEVAPSLLPIRMEPYPLAELPALDEACLSSSSRAVFPIVRVDDVRVGSGTPGPWTRKLLQAYEGWIRSHLEPL